MPQPFDSTVVRAWAALALDALGADREELDSINVFPVADGDTGTNLHRTAAAAAEGVEHPDDDPAGPAAPVLRALARGALLGACGNSGTILAQLLRGMAEVYGETYRGGAAGAVEAADAAAPEVGGGGRLLAAALRRAAESAYEAVARPVEGTMLTVARAAADAAERAVADGADSGAGDGHGDAGEGPGADPGPSAVARAAHDGARAALSATTAQLDALRRAGVVDAGGSGLVAVLGALVEALSDPAAGSRPGTAHGLRSAVTPDGPRDAPAQAPAEAGAPAGDPAYEVMYLLEADDAAVAALREQLDGLGDSLVVGGGDGLWSVHVHVDDAGAAVEAGVEAGRPHRIRVTHLAAAQGGKPDECAPGDPAEHRPRGTDHAAGSDIGDSAEGTVAGAPGASEGRRTVVAVVHGDGLAGLCEEAGALVVRAGEAFGSEGLPAAVRATGAAEVVLLPNDAELHASAARAAQEARESPAGIRVAVVPTRAAVQGIAALAVHDPDRRFDEDVVAMTSAAGATRYGEVTVAERRSWTMAGVCEAGDVLGLVEGDVAVIGSDIAATAAEVLERMLAAGGELVTLVVGERAPGELAARLEERVRSGHLGVDTVVYEGGQQCAPLLIGVE